MKQSEVLEAVTAAAAERRAVALATVVRTRGSVPRHAGSRMLIDAARGLVGTIGGGCGEAEVIAAAREVMTSHTPRLVRVELMDRIDSWSPAVCGGVMEIFVEPVLPALADRGAPPPGGCAQAQNRHRAGPALADRGAPPPGGCAQAQNRHRAGPAERDA